MNNHEAKIRQMIARDAAQFELEHSEDLAACLAAKNPLDNLDNAKALVANSPNTANKLMGFLLKAQQRGSGLDTSAQFFLGASYYESVVRWKRRLLDAQAELEIEEENPQGGAGFDPTENL